MLKKLLIISLVAVVALAACGASAISESRQLTQKDAIGAGAPPAQPGLAQEQYYAADGGVANAPVDQSAASTAGQRDRLVIKNANLSLVVKDPAGAVTSITALAEALGGFVVSSNVYQSSTDAAGNKIMSASVTLRVPAETLNDALAQLKGMAVSVENESLSGEDVTAQYTDLESQLRNLEAAEKQLQSILDDARKTEDVLNVFNQLTAIRGQIEQVKGQMKYFSESAAMSLISLTLIPDALSQPIQIGGWKPEGVAKEALEALVRALQDIATAVIWGSIYVLPLGLLFGLPLWLIGRMAWRRLRKPKPVTAA